jgi:transcriptional regulator with XRE-family HTH domain
MTSPTTTALGRALRELRVEAGLTQAQVASGAGVDHPYVSRMESGQRDPHWSTVVRFLAALDATLADLGDAIERVERESRPARPFDTRVSSRRRLA